MDRSQRTLKRGELGVTDTEEPTGDDPGKPQEGFTSQDDPESGKGSGKAMNADAKMLDESKPASQPASRESWRKTKQTMWKKMIQESAENQSKKKISSKILIRYMFQEADTKTFQGILSFKHFCCIACKEKITENFCRLLVCICFGRLLTEGYIEV